MMEAFSIGATGMRAQQLQVDAVANNLANVNTTGFKKNRISFVDAFYKQASTFDVDANNTESPLVSFGMGTIVSTNSKSFSQGEVKQTDNPLDIAVRGSGFVQVEMPDGTTAYSRTGTLKVNESGLLATATGNPIKQHIEVPVEAQQIVISPTGQVSVKMAGKQGLVELGQLELAMFTNPEGLEALGNNLYTSSVLSGEPTEQLPGEGGAGTLAQGYLEASNVNMAEEMVNLVLAQRAYELNAKVIQAADEMLSISNNLRR